MRYYLFLRIALIVFSIAESSATPINYIDKNSSVLLKKYSSSSYKSTSTIFTIPITNKAPIIKAIGNQIYFPGTSLNIVTDLTINDSNNTGTVAISIQISSNYINGKDLLTLTNPESHSTIIADWNVNEGKLKLSGPTFGKEILYAEFIAAIKDVQFSNSSSSPSGNRTFLITIEQANYLSSNGHFYEYVPNLGISWTSAKASAEVRKYYGLTGYLATITADNEAKIVGKLTSESAWIGGSDAATEGEWRWVTGPEGFADEGAGTIFWNGLAKGSTPNFAFWNSGEPNNSGNEDYAHITPLGIGVKGTWNDLTDKGGNSLRKPKGFMVEYGGMPGDPILEITTSTTITISNTTNTTTYSICDSGSITLQAPAFYGNTIRWYDSDTEGTLLGTGNSYTTPILTTTTIYYIDNENSTTRTAIKVNINKIPSIISTNSGISICDPSSVTLQANTTIGTVNWYASASGGTIEATGINFTTPILTQNTSYYAEAVNNGCTNGTRTPFFININTPPTITATTPASRGDTGTLTLGADSSGGIINWYNVPTGGTSLGTGTSFKTPSITATTTYYVDASLSGCTTVTRTAIIATINISPTITSIEAASRCDTGTVTLGATASAGTINWYDVPTGGTSLGTGTSFKTPSLATTTIYYVNATTSSCTTPTRTAITAIVNISPSITSTTPASRCDTGTLTLGAVASAGAINWYNVPTGGTSIGTGTSFKTPSITATTIYYIDATTSSCTTPTRTAITATINIPPSITSTTPASRCNTGTVTLGATASAGTINWYDVPTGGTSLGIGTTFTTPILTTTTIYYVDANTSSCKTPTRTAITATINIPPSITSTTPSFRCDSGTVTLGATASAGTINWHDVPTGGTSLGIGTSFTTPSITSTTTYYVDVTVTGCTSPRVPVAATIYPVTSLNKEVILCQSETATLDASTPGMIYLWSPGGETTQTIVVSTIGDYSVTISSPNVASCDSNKYIKVIEHPKPIIKTITVNENSIAIELTSPENYYEFSINGEDFQESNRFSDISNGQYTAIVRDRNGCNIATRDFNLFTIAKYFTPNNDGSNDVWEIKEMSDFPNSSAQIFNRYGKVITTLSALKYSWDGNYNNNHLPTDDYWYILNLGNGKPDIKGHFSLKR